MEFKDESGIIQEAEDGRRSKVVDSNEIRKRGNAKNKKKKKKSKNQSNYMPKCRCFSIRSEADGRGNFDMEVDHECREKAPAHLIIMVNGLIGRFVI